MRIKKRPNDFGTFHLARASGWKTQHLGTCWNTTFLCAQSLSTLVQTHRSVKCVCVCRKVNTCTNKNNQLISVQISSRDILHLEWRCLTYSILFAEICVNWNSILVHSQGMSSSQQPKHKSNTENEASIQLLHDFPAPRLSKSKAMVHCKAGRQQQYL